MWYVQGSWWPYIKVSLCIKYICTHTPTQYCFWCKIIYQIDTVCNNQHLPYNPFFVSLPSIEKPVTLGCCQQSQILSRAVLLFARSFVWWRNIDSGFINSKWSKGLCCFFFFGFFFWSCLNYTLQSSVVSKISLYLTFPHCWKKNREILQKGWFKWYRKGNHSQETALKGTTGNSLKSCSAWKVASSTEEAECTRTKSLARPLTAKGIGTGSLSWWMQMSR